MPASFRLRTALCLGLLLTSGPGTCLLRAEETAVPSFELPLEEIAPHLVLITYRAQGRKRRGNGVVVIMDGKSYLMTNLHLVLGAENISFMTADGRRLAPRGVELSNNRDLVRMELEAGTPGLQAAARIAMNTPLAVITGGNGEEQQARHGKVIGIGSTKIEISAAFDDDSNGAPALNAEREVVGIAAYSRSFGMSDMKIGTRFEGKARHFCSRLDKNEWLPVNWRALDSRYGQAYREHDALCRRILAIFEHADTYNASAEEALALANECRSHIRQIEQLCRQKGLTEFLRRTFEEQAELLSFAREEFESYAKSRR